MNSGEYFCRREGSGPVNSPCRLQSRLADVGAQQPDSARASIAAVRVAAGVGEVAVGGGEETSGGRQPRLAPELDAVARRQGQRTRSVPPAVAHRSVLLYSRCSPGCCQEKCMSSWRRSMAVANSSYVAFVGMHAMHEHMKTCFINETAI